MKLGVIGGSPGNGHPISWSVICNQYCDLAEIRRGKFPNIADYLEKEHFIANLRPSVQVTHVWTSDDEFTQNVARSAGIATICNEYTDMIGNIDALLLARDDSINHIYFAKPFLNCGIPVYIDKPIATTQQDLQQLFSIDNAQSLIFSCSALSYSPKLIHEFSKANQIYNINCMMRGKWSTYSMHIIEPVLKHLISPFEPFEFLFAESYEDRKSVSIHFNKTQISANFCISESYRGKPRFEIGGFGGSQIIIYDDTYQAFSSALSAFFKFINGANTTFDFELATRAVSVIEMAI